MRTLYQRWIDDGTNADTPVAEGPPPWMESMTDRDRLHRMEHATHGIREDVRPEDVESLKAQGWKFLVGPEDFGELLHVQAHYFHDRFFPRLQWLILDAPESQYFVIGTAGANLTVTLPPSSPDNAGRSYVIKNAGVTKLTVRTDAGGTDTIGDARSLAVKKQSAATRVADGAGAWHLVSLVE